MAIGRAKTRQRVQTATHRGGRGAHTELGGDLTVLAGRHHVHLGETGVDEGRNEKDGDGDADSGDGGVDDGLSAGNDGHTEVVAIGILTIDGEVWHLPLCIAKSALSVVAVVVGVGEVEVGCYLDAV